MQSELHGIANLAFQVRYSFPNKEIWFLAKQLLHWILTLWKKERCSRQTFRNASFDIFFLPETFLLQNFSRQREILEFFSSLSFPLFSSFNIFFLLYNWTSSKRRKQCSGFMPLALQKRAHHYNTLNNTNPKMFQYCHSK